MGAGRRSDASRVCAFVESGCDLLPQYAITGVMVGPAHLRPLRHGGFVALAYVCPDHVPAALTWLEDAEVIPFAEVPAAAVPDLLAEALGGVPPEVAFVA